MVCHGKVVLTLGFQVCGREIESPSDLLKVEPYSIHGSFLKLEYLKTEFNEDSGTYAIVKVTSHSYKIMVNLSINDYFGVMRHP